MSKASGEVMDRKKLTLPTSRKKVACDSQPVAFTTEGRRIPSCWVDDFQQSCRGRAATRMHCGPKLGE
jgi:hypothetical protein